MLVGCWHRRWFVRLCVRGRHLGQNAVCLKLLVAFHVLLLPSTKPRASPAGAAYAGLAACVILILQHHYLPAGVQDPLSTFPLVDKRDVFPGKKIGKVSKNTIISPSRDNDSSDMFAFRVGTMLYRPVDGLLSPLNIVVFPQWLET